MGWYESTKPGVQPKIEIYAASGPRCLLPPAWELGTDLPETIYAILKAAASQDTLRGDWAGVLRSALSRARIAALAGRGDATQLCVVYQVQRTLIAAGKKAHWQRPYIPT